MDSDKHFRHELKYEISKSDYLELRSRVRSICSRDPHANEEGIYRIRSIYFDNLYDKALKEKNDGAQKREKLRIRWYNDDFSFINSDNAFLLTPSICAASVTLIPNGFITSSKKTDPGCVGFLAI